MDKKIMWLCALAILFYQCSAKKCRPKFYPHFHYAPPYGWMNDPNGFSIFNDEYQLFYQYNPFSSQEPGVANWGHAKSKDLVYWEHLPIAMKPDKPYDLTGAFSGSAIAEKNTFYLIYTGNVNYPDQNPDHIQRQALAYTTDGINFKKYPENPVILGEDYQPNIRDPKIWKHNDNFYLVLGNSFNNNTLGRVLLYKSKNLTTWEMVSILDKSNGSLGYMWECPDFFPLGDYWVLLISPQGIKPQGDKYKNLYQTGYIIGNFDYGTLKFTPKTEFKELDHGHDFYATQTMLDTKKSNRRLMVAWLDMWENVYKERDEGWTGQMIMIRSLELTCDLKILQKPLLEFKSVRNNLLYTGSAGDKTQIKLHDNTAEIFIATYICEDFELILEAKNATVTITYNYNNDTITLDRGGNDGIRRTKWIPENIVKMWIFVDRSSIELFCGDGEITFSSRFFPESAVTVKLGNKSRAYELSVYSMKRTIPRPQLPCNYTTSKNIF